jgi:hypothetical protein
VVTPHELWQPLFHNETWVPRSLQHTPLVRIRDFGQTYITAGAINPVLMLLQPNLSGGQMQMGLLGKSGAGLTAGSAGTIFQTFNSAATQYGEGRARLHRMGCTVSCLGPAGTALLPNGFVKLGCLRSVPRPGAFATWGDLVTHVGAKSELHTRTGYDLMTKPCHVASYPVDTGEWKQLIQANSTTVADYTPLDTMATIGILISTSSNGETYLITSHVEYDYLPSDDGPSTAGLLLGAAAVRHPSLLDGVVDAAIGAAGTVAGVFEKGEAIVSAVQRARTAYQQLTTAIPRPYPAIAGSGSGLRALLDM